MSIFTDLDKAIKDADIVRTRYYWSKLKKALELDENLCFDKLIEDMKEIQNSAQNEADIK